MSRLAWVTIFDEEKWKEIDKLRPVAPRFLALVSTHLPGPVEVRIDGVPFVHLEPLDGPPPAGVRSVNLSKAIDDAIRSSGAIPTHVPAPCADRQGYERRYAAAHSWAATLPPLPSGPLLSWAGRDVISPILRGVFEYLQGALSLTPDDAIHLVTKTLNVRPQVQIAAQVAIACSVPTDCVGASLDQAHREAEEARVRSEKAQARLAKQMARPVDVVIGDDFEGFSCRVGAIPSWAHLVRTSPEGTTVRPATITIDGISYRLRRPIPGLPLPVAEGIIPRDTVLQLNQGQVAAIDGPFADWQAVMSLRKGFGAMGGEITPDEFIGEDDDRAEVVLEQADKLIAENRHALASPLAAPHQRAWLMSALVRGLKIRPELVLEKLLAVTGAQIAPANTMPKQARRMSMSGVFNGTGSWEHEPGEAPEVELPRQEEVAARRDPLDLEAAVLAAVKGDDWFFAMSPGALLPTLEPTFAERVKSLVKTDPWQPLLAAALRGRENENFRSEQVAQMLSDAGQECSFESKTDMSRAKKVMEKLGWSKREFHEGDQRWRAYSKG